MERMSTSNQISLSSSFTSSSSSIPQTQEEAKDTLEDTDSQLSQEDQTPVLEAVMIAFDYLNTKPALDDTRGTLDNRLSITPQAMMQTIITMLKAGYQVDLTSLQAYSSDSDNVYQFTINLTKEEAEPLTLAGNYVIGTSQCDFESLHGIPTGIQ
ncbi:hypothetical protein [Streptococcus sp.]|uniref:hypothetical protein n=2 Tax=Streptococcus TaxID=1301 RepID=UPI00290F6C6F|nr:hypothetical protein [Streptococcus sp.]MDU6118506.1 hypothetical protein [Streptococcus sp.]